MARKNASEEAVPAGTAPTARPNTGVGPLHERITADLRTAIARGDHLPGTKLPTEVELAGRYGAGRGTVRAALRALEAEGLVTSRQGSGRVVLGGGLSQSFDELRSFAQWARATGHAPGGLFVTRVRRPADAIEASSLSVDPGSEVLYTVRLRTLDGNPVLVERCVKCHGGEKVRGGLKLTSGPDLRRGGNAGPVVVPGKPDDSLLVKAVRYTNPELKMPPAGKLTNEQIAALETWVRMGAPDPRDANTTVKTIPVPCSFRPEASSGA